MKEDFNALRLKHHGDADMMHEILQRECRYKCSSKLQETLKCRDFIFPSISVAEMSTSDAIADVHASMITDGERVLDMTCGLGIDSFHMAEKASSVVTMELNHDTFLAAIHNAAALGRSNVSIIEGDSIGWLKDNDERFDTIFIDPARRDASGRHYALDECKPDVIGNLDLLLERCTKLIIKASPMADISDTGRRLSNVSGIVIIGTPKECKELVFICSGNNSTPGTDFKSGRCKISCVTIGKGNFDFTIEDEHMKEPTLACGPIVAGTWLYEPYPAIMKGGCFNSLSRQFNISKLHPNTNLFHSSVRLQDFPGQAFEIIDVLPFNKKIIKELALNYPKINVATRNFPLSAPELAKRLKIKDGGNNMIFGTTGPGSEKLLIITTMGK